MFTSASSLRWGLIAISVGWVIMLIAAAAAASLPHPGSILYAFSTLVYLAGSVVCHQRPERSLHWWSAQAPVCARCVGLYVGAALGAMWAAFGSASMRSPVRSDALDRLSARTRVSLALALIPTLLTLVFEWSTGVMPAHWIRLAAGVVLGAAAACAIAEACSLLGARTT
jgi:uncharacterized membrane protein